MKIFNTANMGLLKRALDVYNKQHEALAENIANAHNPEFERRKTDFSKELDATGASRLKTTDPRHLGSPVYPEGPFFMDDEKEGGPVDLPQEMGELAINQIRYDFVSRVLNRMYRKLNASITGRTS